MTATEIVRAWEREFCTCEARGASRVLCDLHRVPEPRVHPVQGVIDILVARLKEAQS